jgi:hypothetical protein
MAGTTRATGPGAQQKAPQDTCDWTTNRHFAGFFTPRPSYFFPFMVREHDHFVVQNPGSCFFL